MPVVPQYQPNVANRPIHQQGINVNATADDMGAAIGRGMQGLAAGVSQMGDALARVRELEDIAKAKEADNELAAWDREAKYGENGFMTLEGKAAVDGRADYEKRLADKQREIGKGLSPSAQQKYSQASQARVNSSLDQSILHTAQSRKKWFADASTARIDTFAEDALAGYQNPAIVNKNIAAGQAELREMGALQGWDADTLKNREVEYISGVRKNIALRLAQTDPIAASKYVDAHRKELTGSHQYDLDGTLKGAVEEAEALGVAAKILSGPRTETGDAGDIQPARTPQAGRRLADAGPTRVRQLLIDRAPGKGASAVDGLDEAFATNLAAMIEDAPPGIREGLQIMSGHRSHARQIELFNQSDRSGRRVARPGHSNHEERADGTAKAVDLMWNGKTLKSGSVPQHVLEWVHGNAGKYGMYFPMSWEDWHIEPIGTRGGAVGSQVVARNSQVSPRSTMPSYQDIETQLNGITNPRVRDLTRKQIYAAMEMQNKAAEQNVKAAKAELWNAYVLNGTTPDQVDPQIKLLAGEDAVSGIWSYIKTEAERGKPVDDDVAVYGMRRFAATDPAAFAQVDLNDYRDRLSPETFKEMTSLQTSALTDERKAREEGLTLSTAYKQAETHLEALGITTVGTDGSKRQAQAARIAEFNNALSRQMEEFKKAENKNPTQIDIQSMINRMLLPIVIEEEKSMWNPTKTPWSSTSKREGFLFEAGKIGDGLSVDVAVEYQDIPVDLRRGISTRLETELGRKPSEDEIVTEYEAYILGQ